MVKKVIQIIEETEKSSIFAILSETIMIHLFNMFDKKLHKGQYQSLLYLLSQIYL